MVKIYASSKEQTMLIVKHPATTQPRNHKEEKTNKPDPLRKTTQHYSQPTNQPTNVLPPANVSGGQTPLTF